MKEFLSIWGGIIEKFPKKGVYLFIILYFLLKYAAGFTFLWEFWNGRAGNDELLRFLQLLMGGR